MYSSSTVLGLYATLLFAGLAYAQAPAAQSIFADWRQTGNTVADAGLAGNASGPATRVWYADGSVLVRTRSGRIFETSDFEHWQRSAMRVPAIPQSAPVSTLPEFGARAIPAGGGRLYAFGVFVYLSDDGGKSWENLTEFHGTSIVGAGLRDLSVAPGDKDELGLGPLRSIPLVAKLDTSGFAGKLPLDAGPFAVGPGVPSVDAGRQ